ncbi:Oxidative stress-induced growth inhibitor 2 [Eumeta japonica]|uniref:Oxidative stress-induced growth inhibitor 2 n=1 Tax=Eumeta variegata TaxID=151549 RepID=A0A4C1ZAK8_EUMVA|nr:Oxidative stress-induced growth inhibitor 2 [Eumeta japonica]
MKDSMKPCHHSLPEDAVYKEVVVIGNGPSGMVTSFMLAGNVPYLKEIPDDTPIDEMLKARLSSLPPGRSLYEADLEQLAEGLEGRSQNPIPILLDSLMRPGADLGFQAEPLVEWRFEPDKQIDHVVLGRSGVGGAWRTFPAGVVTLSPGAWLTLPPHVSPAESPPARVPARAVAAYCRRYAKLCGIQQYFHNGVAVSAVRRAAVGAPPPACPSPRCPLRARWLVTGYEVCSGRRFAYACSRVVVACGASDRASTLPALAPHAHHSLAALQHTLNTLEEIGDNVVRTVLVVGSGLSAADAVLAARARGFVAAHVHRAPPDTLARLPRHAYPDYAEIYKMMCDGPSGNHKNYISLYGHAVVDVTPIDHAGDPTLTPKRIRLHDLATDQTKEITVSVVAVFIGSKPDLQFLQGYNDLNYIRERDDEPCLKCIENQYKTIEDEQPNKCYLKNRWHYLKTVLEQSIQSCKSRYLNTEINGNDGKNCAVPDCKKTADECTFVSEFQNGTIEAKLAKCGCRYMEKCDCSASDPDGIGLGIDAGKPVDSRSNPIAIDVGTHEALRAPPGMYALGPVAGDNFVRFIPGGALAAVAHVHKTRNDAY